jgi:[ribosomal protein S18]-alanine N-acetyltransferase
VEASRKPQKDAGVIVRPAVESDIARIATIEKAAFSDPWSAASFRSLLTGTAVHFAAAVADDDSVVGYLVMWIAGGEAEIANLAVDASARRQRVGSLLLEHGITVARAAGAEAIFLEVRESNTAARAIYAANGFASVGKRSRYYRRPVEDALVLRLDL